MTDAAPATEYVAGLDLGQSQDFTALAVVERSVDAEGGPASYTVGHLKRWPLKTPYTRIASDLRELLTRPPLAGPDLVVDKTGVGAAVVDLFAAAGLASPVCPVLITSGHETRLAPDGAWHVAKKELVSVLQALLQSRRLRVAALPERALLVKELLAFKVKITAAANEVYESWRERDHDDLVLAVALACWHAERAPRPEVRVFLGPAVPPEGPADDLLTWKPWRV
jgi:hypothetical protein